MENLSKIQIKFLGAAGTVTGSKYLLIFSTPEGTKNILIDCGLFQGHGALKDRNWSAFPIDPSLINAVILTHAHLDHSGYLPLLRKNGFRGPIYATPATKDLCSILLPDSGHLQEEDANFANRHHYSEHQPALPLYTRDEALAVLEQFKMVSFETKFTLFEGCDFIFKRAAHILGAACICLNYLNKKIVFSGDLGRMEDPIMKSPSFIEEADYLITESTYGDAVHDHSLPEEVLGKIINKTIARGGSIIIPAFSVGRTQSLLYYISELKRLEKIPNIPVFLDSPLSELATNIYGKYLDEHCLSKGSCLKLESTATYITSVGESKKLDASVFPSIIISASGMAEGGRIVHHLKAFAPKAEHTILFTGYQAAGTLGDRIVNKKNHEVKIHGQEIQLNAEVLMMSNMSAHADSEEIMTWLGHFKTKPHRVFITHGEPGPALALKEKIEKFLGWNCYVPSYLEKIDL